MSNAKEVRTKIKSIHSTQKITRAMEMVAASKMRKAQDRMRAAKPYAHSLCEVIGNVAHSQSEFKHPFMVARTAVKRAGLIVVSTDKGLCGGLNVNLFKKTIAAMKTWNAQHVEIDLCLIGQKATQFFQRYGGRVVAHTTHLGDAPSALSLFGVVKVMLDAYETGALDRLDILYNEFINTMTQKPRIDQLLPLPKNEDDRMPRFWDYLYEPNAEDLLSTLLVRFIEVQVYQAVVENLACEQAARMVAMKSASDNAGELIREFQLVYNKARQASITRELAEIVAGAAAV